MNEKEYFVEEAKLNVRLVESDLKDAIVAMNEGYKMQVALVEQAKATMEKEYSKLKQDVEKLKIKVEKEKAYLSLKEEEFRLGFTK